MKFRSTLLLLIVGLGLGSYLVLFERHRLSTSQARDRDQLVLQLDRDQVTSISIKNTETHIELRKQPNTLWYLEEPVKDRADPSVINQLFTTAEMLRHDAVIALDSNGPKKAQLKEFGLYSSETRVKFGGEKPTELVLGKDAAVEGKIYAKVEGGNNAYVIPNEIKNQITKMADDFRDRRLTVLATSQINRLIVKSGAGEIELQKKNERWTVIKPLSVRGDNARIGDLISQATTARIESFVADSANLAAYGLQEPRGTVSLYTEGEKEPVILQIGTNPPEAKDKAKTYAKISNRESVVLLPKAIEELLKTKPNDIRDKSLLQFESDIVDRITLEAAGKEKLVLARQGEEWVRKAPKDLPINSAAANALLSSLKSQQIVEFVADVATDLPKYGLDRPLAKVTLSSFASENTAETRAGEKPIVSVLFGKIEGESVYAKIDDEPFVVSVNRSVLDSIPVDPIQWQPLSLQKIKPEEITRLEVTRAGQPAITLERDKDKWKLAKGDGYVNQINAQSLINTLCSLRAVRWIGPATPDLGLATPALSVEFKTAATTGKLSIGNSDANQSAPASVTGFEGAFELSRPDRGAFELSLVDKPAEPTPQPAPSTETPSALPGPASAP